MGFEHSSFEFWFCFEFRVSCFGFYALTYVYSFSRTILLQHGEHEQLLFYCQMDHGNTVGQTSKKDFGEPDLL